MEADGAIALASTLVGRSFARIAWLVVGVACVLSAFAAGLVLIASSYQRTGSFEALALLAPSFLQGSLGPRGGGLASFQAMVALAYFHPLVTMAVAVFAAHVAAEPASDAETGLVDLILTRPIRRHWIVTRTWVTVIASTTLVVGTMRVATMAALATLAPDTAPMPLAGTLNVLSMHLLMVSWCIGAVTLAVAAVAQRRATATTTVAGGALALYLLDLIAPFWPLAGLVAWVSPFHYFHGSAILAGLNASGTTLGVLAASTVIALLLAYRNFSRRDL
jgi:ABC-2 type transport system permease protein